MENYNVKFLQTAIDDLEKIIIYIAADSKDAAIRWHDNLIEKLNRLTLFPKMGIKIADKKMASLEFRMLPIKNYILFYRVFEKEKEVIILRVLDAKRDYPRIFKDYTIQSDSKG
ncbi:toxin ParE1/3/4 [Sedimentibacter acidaminivorans]|uniref:Toxin ParE1/3/4 n=1 Tax=Sedimentibacter acidaminivorans TaxID=913099 RepID=A0ABS4GFI6_9FIRM|nr:type II toxin-antitoxin system RelE/ParE family toxin [Sedimentibacter acidaminivorans]MBP1926145.1 toxin ParE1/3/4 [Sedimentibacter acidaminivorans]